MLLVEDLDEQSTIACSGVTRVIHKIWLSGQESYSNFTYGLKMKSESFLLT